MLDVTVTVRPDGEMEINWPFDKNIACGNHTNYGDSGRNCHLNVRQNLSISGEFGESLSMLDLI